MTKMPFKELEQIIDYIELMLNKPINDLLIKQLDQLDEENKEMSSEK